MITPERRAELVAKYRMPLPDRVNESGNACHGPRDLGHKDRIHCATLTRTRVRHDWLPFRPLTYVGAGWPLIESRPVKAGEPRHTRTAFNAHGPYLTPEAVEWDWSNEWKLEDGRRVAFNALSAEDARDVLFRFYTSGGLWSGWVRDGMRRFANRLDDGESAVASAMLHAIREIRHRAESLGAVWIAGLSCRPAEACHPALAPLFDFDF